MVGISRTKTGSDITSVRAVPPGGESHCVTYVTSHCNGDVNVWRTDGELERGVVKDILHSVVCLKGRPLLQ